VESEQSERQRAEAETKVRLFATLFCSTGFSHLLALNTGLPSFHTLLYYIRYVHMEAKDRVSRAEFDYGRLDLLDSKLNQDVVGPDEAAAIAAHLHANYPIFRYMYSLFDALLQERAVRLSTCRSWLAFVSDRGVVLSEPQYEDKPVCVLWPGREKPDGTALTLDAIKDFMQGQTAITLRRQGSGTASAAGPPPADVLYRRGRPALQLTLVLSGKVTRRLGSN